MTTAEVLKQAGAVLTDSHFVYTSGKHGPAYVNKDALYPNPTHVNSIGRNIVNWVSDMGLEVDVVIAPAIGAVKLEKAVVEWLRAKTSRSALGGYAEQEQRSIKIADEDTLWYFSGKHFSDHANVPKGAELVIKLPSMVIKRGYEVLVPGKNVLVVEDILNTGRSARRTVDAVRELDGNVLAVAAICNRGGVTAETLGVELLHSEVEVQMQAYDPKVFCPLCSEGVPINTQYGHGKAFLAQQAKA